MSRPTLPTWLRRVLGIAGAVLALGASFFGAVPEILAIPALGLLLTFTMRPSPEGAFLRPGLRTALVLAGIALGLAAIVAQPLALAWYFSLVGYNVGLLLLLVTVSVLVLPLVATESLGSPAVRLTRRGLGLTVTAAVTVASLFATSGQSFVAIALLAVVVPVVGAVSLVRRRGTGHAALRRRVVGAAAGISVATLLIVTLALGTFSAVTMDLGAAGYAIAAAIYVAGALGIAALGLAPIARRDDRGLVLAALAIAFLGAQTVAVLVPPTQPTLLASPLSDDTFVGHGGSAELVNYHYTVSAQRDALDLVQLEEGTTHPAGATDLADFAIFDKPVLAGAAGVVTEVADGFPDSPIGQSDPLNPTGNHVVVDIGDGRFVVYAHLREGTVGVEVGDRVVVGDELGRVGNSGNSTEPHLHIQVQNLPTVGGGDDLATFLATARTYPIRFTDVVVGGAGEPRSLDARRGDVFRPSP